ncbi:hypothetical protein OIE68_45380 [Nocardia vinacea]|uniref:hypothetical protein n=1 Tax=Nocardia vinacea TaxID=96468 RepID=UPI002E0F239F|nr:hypothetical protein OIE68_45380 [Nocardia vinacea]
MSSGDPVEESSQAMRQGFVQALQTAHTTAALMRGRGGESRSRAESEQRMRLAGAKDWRSFIEHRLRVIDTVDLARQAHELNTAKVDEVRARIERGGEMHEMEQWIKERQAERADADLDRRDEAGDLEREHNIEIHDLKVDAYANREIRAAELHELDVELKELLIESRRRAAGLSETLASHGDAGEAMASAAAFAAAKGAEGLSEQLRDDSDAYDERFVEDTGSAYTDIIDAEIVEDFDDRDVTVEPHSKASEVAIENIIDADIIDDFDDLGVTVRARSRSSSVAVEDIAGLTEELSFATHLIHEFADLRGDPDPDPDAGSVIADAADAAGLTSETLAEDMDFGPEVDPLTTHASPIADLGTQL